jgi:hypothetical protein
MRRFPVLRENALIILLVLTMLALDIAAVIVILAKQICDSSSLHHCQMARAPWVRASTCPVCDLTDEFLRSGDL